MRVLSIKVPIRKKSGNLFNDPRIFIFTSFIKFINSLGQKFYSNYLINF